MTDPTPIKQFFMRRDVRDCRVKSQRASQELNWESVYASEFGRAPNTPPISSASQSQSHRLLPLSL